MNPRLLTTLAIAASSLVVAACGKSNQPAVSSQVQPAPAAVPQTAPQAAAPTVPQAASGTTTAHVPSPAPVATNQAAQTGRLVIQGYAVPVPNSWTPTQPSSSMRVAQFSLPAAPGSDPGEVATYYFPAGQGGSHEANIERWASQFAGPDGKPVAPKTSISKSGDTEVTLVELNGTYARGVGMGPSGDAKPDQTLMIAMVEVPNGRITLQMYGPNKTVAAQRDNFVKLAKGFHPA